MRRRPVFAIRILLLTGTAAALAVLANVHLQKEKNVLLKECENLVRTRVRAAIPYSPDWDAVSFHPGGITENSANVFFSNPRLRRAAPGAENDFFPARIEFAKLFLDYRLSDIFARKFFRWKRIRVEGGKLIYGSGALVEGISGEVTLGEGGWSFKNCRARVDGVGFLASGEMREEDGRLEFNLTADTRDLSDGGNALKAARELIFRLVEEASAAGKAGIAFSGRVASPEQAPKEMKVEGVLRAGERVFRAEGEFSLAQKRCAVRLMPENSPSDGTGSAGLILDFSRKNGFLADIRFDHFPVGGRDIFSRAKMSAQVSGPSEGEWSVSGKVTTGSTLVDHRPFREVAADYRLTGTGIEVSSLSLGEEYHLSGDLTWEDASEASFQLKIKNAELSDFIVLDGADGTQGVSGKVSGYLNVSGSPAEPDIKLYLAGEEIKIGYFAPDWARAEAFGKWPVIRLADSSFKAEGGIYLLTGEIDLRRFGTSALLQGLEVVSDRRTVIWSGWGITREEADTKLKMSKEVGEEFRISFNTLIFDEARAETDDDGEMELLYRLGGHRNLKMQLKKDEEFLAIEHKIKF